MAARLGLKSPGSISATRPFGRPNAGASQRRLTARFVHFNARHLADLAWELFDTVIVLGLEHTGRAHEDAGCCAQP